MRLGSADGRFAIPVLAAGQFFAQSLIVGFAASSAVADPVVSSVGLLSRVILTDNLFLTREGKESAAILQLLPNISGGRTGRSADYRFYYGPSVLFYGGGYSDLNRVFQVFQGDANIKLIDEYLGLAISARANQNVIDPSVQSVGFNALGNPDAFAQTASIQVSPVIRFPILRGDFATVELSPGINYSFTAGTAGESNQDGNYGSQSSLSIVSGDYFSRMPWSVNATSNYYDQGGEQGTASFDATATYILTPRWQIQGLVGYDDGNYDSLSSTGGARWRITPYWSPSANTTVGLGYGYRYFGPDYYASIQHTFKKLSVSASYETTISNARTELLNQTVVNFEDPFGQPILDPLGDQSLSGSITNPPLVSGFFVQDQLNGTVAYNFGRTVGTFTVLQNHWDYQSSDLQIDQTQGSLVFNRQMSLRTAGTVGFQYWTYNQSGSSLADFNESQVWTQVDYRLNTNLYSGLTYFYSERSSDTPLQNFDENVVWLTLRWIL